MPAVIPFSSSENLIDTTLPMLAETARQQYIESIGTTPVEAVMGPSTSSEKSTVLTSVAPGIVQGILGLLVIQEDAMYR